MQKRLVLLAALLIALTSGQLMAEETQVPLGIDTGLMSKLRHGGLLIFFRHGLTPNHKDALDRDPDDPLPGNCSHQRNLSSDGIDQSRTIGEAFRDLEIPLGIVRASPMCRSYDTAWYAFGRYERDRNMLLHGSNPEKDPPEAKIWKNIRNIARIPPLPMTNSVFVSHGTVGEVFGAGYLEEGEAIIVEPDGKGGWSLLARVKSDQWKAP
jgi:phosphohistidine phosphatase SixA